MISTILLVCAISLVLLAITIFSRRSGILVDRDILKEMARGSIIIEPFDRSSLGTNSYDVHLAPTLRVYKEKFLPGAVAAEPLDVKSPRETTNIEIPGNGYVLEPHILYLASTIEYTETRDAVPMLNGRSSIGRLGLSVHVTAGTGDVGFSGHWTLEITVIHPLRVYPGIPIGQLLYLAASSTPLVPYWKKASAKYTGRDPFPQASRMWKDFNAQQNRSE